MEKFSVKQLSRLAGVTVRTLHHYDKIGLMKPAFRAESGYRYYTRAELLKLQQILLYREMDFSLHCIKEIINDPDFDLIVALKEHLNRLRERHQSVGVLIATVERTIDELQKDQNMNYEEMYKGFRNREEAEKLTEEAKVKWGEQTIAGSHKKILAMTKKEWQELQSETEEVNRAMVKLIKTDPSGHAVQELVKRHYRIMGFHLDITPEIYRAISTMYVEDSRFTAYYDRYTPGLAVFIRDAIHVFCNRNQG